MKKFYLLLLLILTNIAFATGASHLNIQMVPLAMNADGWILLKARIQSNPSGGHGQDRLSYRLIIFDQYRMVFDQEYLSLLPREDKTNAYNRAILAADTDFNGLKIEGNHYLMYYIREFYNFKKYTKLKKVDKVIPYDEFRMQYTMSELSQITAGGYRSAGYPSDEVHILYENKSFALIKNEENINTGKLGDDFSIPVPGQGWKYFENPGYDIYSIDGLIFK